MTANLSESPQNIIKRLEKLRQWQEEQQKILIERQTNKRHMLNAEHRRVREEFGFAENKSNGDNRRESLEASDNILNGSVIKDQKPQPKVPKQPFLKRGEGLTNRFGIHPDNLRLNNLPKYKYANAYKSFVEKRQGKSQQSRQAVRRRYEPQKLKTGAKTQNVIRNPRTTAKKLVLIKSKSKTSLKRERSPKSTETDSGFQSVSKTSPQKSRTSSVSFENCDRLLAVIESASENQNFNHKEAEQDQECQSLQTAVKSNPPLSNAIVQRRDENSLASELQATQDSVEPISWAQVLDTYNPIPIERFRQTLRDSPANINKTDEEQESLSLFELLERKAQDGSFSLNLSSIKRWIEASNSLDLSENDTQVPAEISKKGICPVPFDIEKKIALEETDEEVEESCGEPEDNVRSEKGHVRFNDAVEVNEVESETETLSNDLECINLSKVSTPNGRHQFEKFNAAIFGNDSTNTEESTLIEDKKLEIIEKSELLKTRLQELENEIESFKTSNAELIKLKQQHELDKIELQQERIELEERLNDEKIKIEIYLHDERMKIEEERRKFEKLQRQPNRRDREEIARLKEQVEVLQKEKSEKETKHCAAQGRLRAQIRNLEKEIRDLNIEVDHLKKENKKLISENAQLNRQNNNKMLQEINKTIAKLAPKVETTEVKNKNPKTVVAKVVSLKKPELRRKDVKSKSIPELHYEDVSSSEDADSSSSETEKSLGIEEDSPYLRGNRKKKSNKNKGKSQCKEIQSCETSDTVTDDTPRSNSKDFIPEMNKSATQPIKREIVNPDGSRDIWFPNGNIKKISADNMIIKMLYFNKDIKETNITEGTVKYYYADANTWHTTYLDGLQIIEYPNGQTEHRYKDGKIEVHFPDGSIKTTDANDTAKLEEWQYPDGTTLVEMKNGDKILSMPNGEREIHTKLHKRREYPDGTVKMVYPDGSQETRYSNGRVRLKDKDGNLVMDSINSNY